MPLDVKVGDFWSYPDDRFRRIMDMVDTGIDQVIYWKDESRCTGRCVMTDFEAWVSHRGARLTKRQSEKGFRLEHNERFKKCGNYALGNSGLPKTDNTEQSQTLSMPSEGLTADTYGTGMNQPAETSPVPTTPSADGSNAIAQVYRLSPETERILREALEISSE